MIIYKASKEDTKLLNVEAEVSIHMWEGIKRAGTIYYVPLDKNLNPLSDIALEDIHGPGGNGSAGSGNFVLVSGVLEKVWPTDIKPKSLKGLIAKAIEIILREGDATTYQIYEALIKRLISSHLLDAVPSEALNVEEILLDNFQYYWFRAPTGVVVKRWTLDEERAKSSRRSALEV